MKFIRGLENSYGITEDGSVFSYLTLKYRKLHVNKAGYVVFTTRLGGRKGKTICRKVHRCVAEAYLENPDNKPEVNHKNGNKQDNSKLNLEWATKSENIQHAFDNGLMIAAKGIFNSNSQLSLEDISLIRVNEHNLSIRELGKLFGVHHATISRCKTGKRYK